MLTWAFHLCFERERGYARILGLYLHCWGHHDSREEYQDILQQSGKA